MATTAYDMSASLGFGPVASGWMVGARFGLSIPTALLAGRVIRPWNQSLCWSMCLGNLILAGAVQMCIMAIAQAASGMDATLCFSLLMFLRVVGGSMQTSFFLISNAMVVNLMSTAQR